jgi:2-haloacid dehalogenase
MRWITFDCFGTLVDWQAGFASAVRPLFGERTDDVLRAYYAHEAIVERLKPHRLYKEVLVTALARAAQECGMSMPSAESARSLAEAWGVDAGVRRCRADVGGASSSGLASRGPHELR